jgi:hypothetical protein
VPLVSSLLAFTSRLPRHTKARPCGWLQTKLLVSRQAQRARGCCGTEDGQHCQLVAPGRGWPASPPLLEAVRCRPRGKLTGGLCSRARLLAACHDAPHPGPRRPPRRRIGLLPRPAPAALSRGRLVGARLRHAGPRRPALQGAYGPQPVRARYAARAFHCAVLNLSIVAGRSRCRAALHHGWPRSASVR